MSVEVFSPIGRHPEQDHSIDISVPDLGDALIGILDNTKPNARLLMEQVARSVTGSDAEPRITIERKPSAAEGVQEDVRERLAAIANVIFTGSGD